MSMAIQCVECPSATLFGGVGFSDEFLRLKRHHDKAIKEFRSAETIGRSLEEALERLEEVFQECSEEGWDGYDAEPITEETYLEAKRFVEALPLFIPKPEITPEPSGEIGLEWSQGRNRVFVVSVSGRNELVYAGVFGINEIHGVEYFGDFLPAIILENLKRLYTPK